MSEPIRVLVVDDTVVYRKIMSDILNGFPDLEVVGTAVNGKIALDKIMNLKPDLVTLDIEMPLMGGLEVLAQLKKRKIDTRVIVVSAVTSDGADATMKAMELGAKTFFTKPTGRNIEESKKILYDQIMPVIKGIISRIRVRSFISGKSPVPTEAFTSKKYVTEIGSVSQRMEKITGKIKPEIIAIGVSTGGPLALARVLTLIPASFKLPIVIVQHMPPIFTKALADSLDKKSDLTVVEAEHDQILKSGFAYIAPGGRQMKLKKRDNGQTQIIITDDPPENHCKPAADYLFRSVSLQYYSNAVGVIMTGMGRDGTLGLRLMKRRGAYVIAQDEITSVVFGMPQEAIKAGVVDKVVPDTGIAQEIIRLVN